VRRFARPSNEIESGGIPPETLPCPACHRVTIVVPTLDGTETVLCRNCGKLLRRRPALSAEQRAQAHVLRWAATQIEASMTTRHRRKPRGDTDEIFENGMARVVEQLLSWSRLVHKLPPIQEAVESGGPGSDS
jgi:hypothetical protein